ncbi:MAG: hypothetical protein ONB23_11945 [candidate division KSB1 bacterium]|nr:hypothetical protein [candidate division KSB1 bacterium]
MEHDPEEIRDELRKRRWLRFLVDLSLTIIREQEGLTVAEAVQIVGQLRRTATAMFPGSETAFDLIYKPRLERAIQSRFDTN